MLGKLEPSPIPMDSHGFFPLMAMVGGIPHFQTRPYMGILIKLLCFYSENDDKSDNCFWPENEKNMR
jgi:hypothetical protein